MSSLQANVSKVLTFSAVDGPGNRLVLFLQGCNFHCLACHNPHTIGQCDSCGLCIAACPRGALDLAAGLIQFRAEACDQCDACLAACPISANPMIRRVSVEDVLALVRANRDFLDGVTVSGGEATVQAKFVEALFAAIKAAPDLAGLSLMIDSNGHCGERAWAALLPVTDGVMLDVKAFDPALHLELTGRPNDKSLGSVRIAHAAGKLYELRFLLIPGHTDTEAEIASLSRFARSLGGPVRVKLNAFQNHGVRGTASGWPAMTRAGVEAVAARLRVEGVGEVVTPVVYI